MLATIRRVALAPTAKFRWSCSRHVQKRPASRRKRRKT